MSRLSSVQRGARHIVAGIIIYIGVFTAIGIGLSAIGAGILLGAILFPLAIWAAWRAIKDVR